MDNFVQNHAGGTSNELVPIPSFSRNIMDKVYEKQILGTVIEGHCILRHTTSRLLLRFWTLKRYIFYLKFLLYHRLITKLEIFKKVEEKMIFLVHSIELYWFHGVEVPYFSVSIFSTSQILLIL